MSNIYKARFYQFSQKTWTASPQRQLNLMYHFLDHVYALNHIRGKMVSIHLFRYHAFSFYWILLSSFLKWYEPGCMRWTNFTRKTLCGTVAIKKIHGQKNLIHSVETPGSWKIIFHFEKKFHVSPKTTETKYWWELQQ